MVAMATRWLLLLLLATSASCKKRKRAMATATPEPQPVLDCVSCLAVQDAIQRSIVHNISEMQRVGIKGGMKGTLPIQHLIPDVCSSKGWKDARYRPAIDASCREISERHWSTLFEIWSEEGRSGAAAGKNAYDVFQHDSSVTLRVKRAACGGGDKGLSLCAPHELPPDPATAAPLSRCMLCKAMAVDTFHALGLQRDKPKSPADTAYHRLAEQLSHVCDELPMHRPILPRQVAELREGCQDLWEEHEEAWLGLLTDRTSQKARRICSQSAKLCDRDLTREELYSHNPAGARRGAKDEL